MNTLLLNNTNWIFIKHSYISNPILGKYIFTKNSITNGSIKQQRNNNKTL